MFYVFECQSGLVLMRIVKYFQKCLKIFPFFIAY